MQCLAWEGLDNEKEAEAASFQDPTAALENIDLGQFASNEPLDIFQFLNSDFVGGTELPLPDITATAADLLPVKEEPGSPGGSSDLDASSPSSPSTDECSNDSVPAFEFGGDYDNLNLKLNFPLGSFDSTTSNDVALGLVKEELTGVSPSALDLKPDPAFTPDVIDTYSTASGKRPREDTTLSGEQLRKLSSGTPNGGACVASPADARKTPVNLTPDEERQMKRQRRLIKNRESAQKSRLRKKMYIEELESKVNTLTSQSERLMQENAKLREDLSCLTKYIRGLKPGVGVIDVDASATAVSAHSVQQQAMTVPPAVRRVSGVAPKNVKAAGICLLIVLFSFGLFFNARHGPNGPALPYEPSAVDSLADATFGRRIGNRFSGRILKSFREAGASTAVGEVSDLSETFPTKRGLPELPSADSGLEEEEDRRIQKKRRTAGLPAITALPMPDKEKPVTQIIDSDTDTDDDDDYDDVTPISSPINDLDSMTTTLDSSLGRKAIVSGKSFVDTVSPSAVPFSDEEVEEEVESGSVVTTKAPATSPISMLIPKDNVLNETLTATRNVAVAASEAGEEVDPPMIEVSQLRSSAVSVS